METERQPDATIEGLTLQAWLGCCVYGWKRSNQYLYIGTSSCGLSRPLKHNVINVSEYVQSCDSLDVWYFSVLGRSSNIRDSANPKTLPTLQHYR